MTEAQQPQNLQNGAREEEIQILVSNPSQPSKPPGFQQNGRNGCGYFASCSLRRLAIVSIVCGFSCVGIKALILALQAEQESDQGKRRILSQLSRKFSILSILLFVVALLSLPGVLVLISYLMTLIE
ncbi:transmembrane protein 265 [Eleutherodactylus coqui]|uniref:transmembrane protein 265 n=1 Tax=Eleutherodactylus coqui TaxID=57060 RepID=UPI003461D85D